MTTATIAGRRDARASTDALCRLLRVREPPGNRGVGSDQPVRGGTRARRSSGAAKAQQVDDARTRSRCRSRSDGRFDDQPRSRRAIATATRESPDTLASRRPPRSPLRSRCCRQSRRRQRAGLAGGSTAPRRGGERTKGADGSAERLRT
jgi:hypothetical protein